MRSRLERSSRWNDGRAPPDEKRRDRCQTCESALIARARSPELRPLSLIRTEPHDRPHQDPLHHRHRLPRRRAKRPSCAISCRTPAGGVSRCWSTSSAISASTVPSSRAAASAAAPRTTSSNCPTAASAAPWRTISSRRSTKLLDRPNPPEHILIETSGLALPKPLVTAFNWPAIRSRVTVDGVIAVVDGPAVAAGFFADDPGGARGPARGGPVRRARQPARGGVRGPAPLRRHDPAQQDRPDERRGQGAREGRHRRAPAALGQDRRDQITAASIPP